MKYILTSPTMSSLRVYYFLTHPIMKSVFHSSHCVTLTLCKLQKKKTNKPPHIYFYCLILQFLCVLINILSWILHMDSILKHHQASHNWTAMFLLRLQTGLSKHTQISPPRLIELYIYLSSTNKQKGKVKWTERKEEELEGHEGHKPFQRCAQGNVAEILHNRIQKYYCYSIYNTHF